MRLNPPKGHEDETEKVSQNPVTTEVTTTGGTKVTFLVSVTLHSRVSQEHLSIQRPPPLGDREENV